MTTTTKDSKKTIKYDIKAMAGDLSKDEPPKSLQECLHEAGGFPFAARAVVDLTCSGVYEIGDCVGDDIRVLCTHSRDAEFFNTDTIAAESGYTTVSRPRSVKRWQLLGHKT